MKSFVALMLMLAPAMAQDRLWQLERKMQEQIDETRYQIEQERLFQERLKLQQRPLDMSPLPAPAPLREPTWIDKALQGR